MKVADSQASGQGFLAFSRALVLAGGSRGGVHSSSAIKSNNDTQPMSKLKCQVHLASVSFQIWTLAVKHPTHYLPDINILVTLPEFYEETNRLSLADHLSCPPASRSISNLIPQLTQSGGIS